MASFSDTHITFSAQSDRSVGSAPALGGAVGRMDGGLNAGGTEALRVECART